MLVHIGILSFGTMILRMPAILSMTHRKPPAWMLLFLAAGCGDTADEQLFERLPARYTGITFSNTITENDSLYNPLAYDYVYNGAGVGVGDVDGNGLDDVFVGADAGHRGRFLLQVQPGRFVERPIEEDQGFEDMGALLFDADGDGDLDLYVVSGGNRAAPEAGDAARSIPGTFSSDAFHSTQSIPWYQDRLYVNDGGGRFGRAEGALPEITSSGSSVTAADYDGDGDLDLFVGGRVVPGAYPLPARSYLLRNDSDGPDAVRFTDVTDVIAPGLSEIGLVTSALWTDYDGDGDGDLLIAGEWMPLTLFRNLGDRFEQVTAAAGLAETAGWWNSLSAGDFDADGDIDYVAGNLGLNAPYRATLEEPVRVYARDFDENGSVDPVLTQYIEGKSYPTHPRAQLIAQVRGMQKRFPTYLDYPRATLERTFTRDELEAAYVAESVQFASSYVENRGDGTFEVRGLPVPAQAAPTFGMRAGDFDGDGTLDLLLVGNAYAADVQTGRYDAHVGGLLQGDGRGGFRFASYTETGFLVDGDAKAMAELVLDEARSLILVTQNDDSLRVFSRAAGSGTRHLRVRADDRYALLTGSDGRTRREEFYYGSTYLSQSSRFLRLTPKVRHAVVYDGAGNGRVVYDAAASSAQELTDLRDWKAPPP